MNASDRDDATDSGLDGTTPLPVIVDDVKSLGNFRMTRCTFFGIEASAAVHDWVADLRDRGVPFLLFGLSAALHRPEGRDAGPRDGRFSTPEQVDGLFDAIEDTEGLLVETEHVWLPNFLLEGGVTAAGGKGRSGSSKEPRPPDRGDVFRIHPELFRRSLQFRRGVTDATRFTAECRELASSYGPLVEPSPAETEVFRQWSAAQLRQARDNYQRQKADPERGVLAWLDDNGEAQPG